MSEDEPFLARWARRKRAIQEAERRGEPLPQEPVEEEGVGSADPIQEAPAEPELSPEELAQLPSVDELTPETDISVFLRKGVPQSLRNAVFRRMWSLDPSIRDYVGDARDYAYDWNTPGGVPGFGPILASDDTQGMMARIFGESPPEVAQQREPSEAMASHESDQNLDGPPARQADQATPNSPQGGAAPETASSIRTSPERLTTTGFASRPEAQIDDERRDEPVNAPLGLRRHGSAKPG
jgi:hypothetical protein